MFKGRIVPNKKETVSVSGTFTSGANMSNITEIEGIPIAQGMVIRLTYNITLLQFPFGFFETDNGGYISETLIAVVDNATKTVEHTIAATDADGIGAFCSVSGQHTFSYTVEIIENVLIDNPVSAIKHIKQCQNWSELNLGAATYDWGKEVVPDAIIKTTGEGSFNSTTLDEIRALKIARQFFDETYTADTVESVLKEFCLTSYQDNNGYECLKSILTKENPSEVITFADIKGEVGDMIEPQLSDIYCTPVFNYAFDYATEKYTKQIRVEKVWETTYDASYTPGLNGTDGATIWALCRALWLKTRQVEPMPQDMSNHEWVPDYGTAVWCLKQQLKMMTIKRCNFNVGYTLGRKWNIGKHFMLQLPHETNNNQVECVVERIAKKKNDNTVSVQIMILDEISFFFES